MASGTNTYKSVDGKYIEIKAGGSTININFDQTRELFNRYVNNDTPESEENKINALAILNEDILRVYNTIINGGSYLTNALSTKRKYSKKITDLIIKLNDMSSREIRCVIPDKKNYNDIVSSTKFVRNKWEAIIKDRNKALEDYYQNCLSKIKDITVSEKIQNCLSDDTEWEVYAYANTLDDYLNKDSYIVFEPSDTRNPEFTNTEDIPFGQHFVMRHVGFIPSFEVIEKWIKEVNKELEKDKYEVQKNVVSSIKAAANAENPYPVDINKITGDIIVSKGEEEKNPLNQIFDDCKDGSAFFSAFRSYFGYKKNTFDNKNLTEISSALKTNNYFNINFNDNFKTLKGIWGYISEALKNCFKNMKTSEASNAENIMNFFKRHKAAGSYNELFQNEKFQSFIDVDNYYDFYSVMTPRVNLEFILGNGEYGVINNTRHSFIKSMNMTDNGAKRFKIVLYDRDFNTPIKLYGKDIDKKTGQRLEINKSLSLDKIIAKALNLNSTAKHGVDNNSKKIKKYSLGASNFGDMLGFHSDSTTLGNLIITYGFNDSDMPMKNKVKYEEKDVHGKQVTIGKTNYYIHNVTTEEERDHRWWNTNTDISKLSNKTHSKRMTSPNPTTCLSYKIPTIVTGYSTKFTEGGIYYTLECIEFSEAALNNYKIYQRYTNIVGTPKEVLYSIIKIIEGLFGNEIKLEFEDDLLVEDGIYEETEQVIEDSGEGEETIGERIKEVSVSLGSKDALSMYRSDDEPDGIATETSFITSKKAKMYKSVGSLLNDLCAVMPAKLDKNITSEEVLIEDEDGNSKKVNEAYKTYRRFTYTVMNGENGKGPMHIIFHYQKPRHFPLIRKYCWGPANGVSSVIKNVDISTENEYSLLSSMTVINYDKDGLPKKTLLTRDGGSFEDNDSDENGKIEKGERTFSVKNGTKADYISSPGSADEDEQRIAMSYAQCLYQGKITILGDPFYNFDKFVTPYTFPIYLDFKIPCSEIEIYQNYAKFDKDIEKTRRGYSHFMSGFYVITSIEQNISESGFTTTLGVMSYPNITKDMGIS